MARSINKVILLGYVTRDPVLRYTKSGKAVCDFGIATNSAYTDEKGQLHENAQFHNIVAWGKLAEIAGEYLTKGRKVYVEGKLQTRSYETTDGLKKAALKLLLMILSCLMEKGKRRKYSRNRQNRTPRYPPKMTYPSTRMKSPFKTPMERYNICQGCNREYQGSANRSRRDNTSLICAPCAKLEEFAELLMLGSKPPSMNLQVIWEHLILYA